jgi:hypothetical protein
MIRPSSHPFDALAIRFARVVTESIKPLLAGSRVGVKRGPSKLRGRKLEMACRYPGCKNRSKGPRFRFLCEKHRKLPKRQQLALLAKNK